MARGLLAWWGVGLGACVFAAVGLGQGSASGGGSGGGDGVGEREDGGVVGSARPGDLVRVRFEDEAGRRLAVEGTVRTVIEGEGGVVILLVDGALETVALDRVLGVEVLRTAYRRYVARRAALEDGDVAGRLALIRWLERHELFEAGLEEVDALLADEPGLGEALRLKRLLRARLLLEARSGEGEGGGSGDGADGRGGDGAGEGVPMFDGRRLRRPTREELPRLTAEQMNLVRVFELDIDDPPRVEVPDAVVDELLLRYADSPLVPRTREGQRAFRRLSDEEILSVMFRLRAREFYPRVEVRGDPASIERFREEVHTRWLVSRCATTRCHGGVDAGRFQLVNTRINSAETVYTNYYIVKEYVDREGVARMVDWEDPGLSLMLQMALPREEALYPHPEVPAGKGGWRPLIRDRDSRAYEETVEWIGSAIRPRPGYALSYETPRERWERLRGSDGAGGGGGGDGEGAGGGGDGDGGGGDGG